MKVNQAVWSFTALAVVFAGCSTPEKPPPPEAPPVITTFSVDRSTISNGEAVTFTLATQRASSAAIIDQDGTAIPVTFDAASGTGTATARPTASSFFILHADGVGGRDTAFVQVAVNEDLKTVFLVVAPRTVRAGESVDVVWAAANGQNVSVRAGQRSLGTTTSGAVTDTPSSSTEYTLSAEKADGTTLSASVDVVVSPVIEAFTATPPAAPAGEDITLSWKTAGGERVVISEASFGQLVDSSTEVASGSTTFTVPSALDGGVAVRDGFPLRFTLTLSTTTPAQAVTRAIDGRVGQGPVIDAFDVPANGTKDRPQTIAWQTTNAWRVELYADGLLIASPLDGQSLDGSFTVPPIAADTEFTLVAYDYNGLSVRATKTTHPVPAPTITSFTVPATIATAGAPVMAQWQTTNAARVVIRVKGGANLYFSDVPAEVNGAARELRVGATTTFVLEAANAAGDVVTVERTTTVASPVGVTFSPALAPANTPLTASWDVTSLGPVDLPGLPNTAPQVAFNSTRFVDLDTVPLATALRFANPDNATAGFTAPLGFAFPFVTSRVTTFGASTNGALVLGLGTAGNTNVDVGAATYVGLPLLAPFWDDLDLGADGSVKYFVDGAQFPRRLIVQWTKVQQVGSGALLTFQVQLSETGEFVFVYQAMTGANSALATIGAVESPRTYAHALGFNTAGLVTTGQETLWFGNDLTRAVGTQSLTLPGSRTFGFFARKASDELIAVSGTARVFAANAVQITEAMPMPSPTLTLGQWVELYNPSKDTIDLSGLELAATSDAGTPIAFQGLSIDAGAHLVLGQSLNPADNGGAGVSVAWATGELAMQPVDRLELRIPGATPVVLSSLEWVNAPVDGGYSPAPGQSVQPPDRVVEYGDTPRACTRTRTYGAAAQVGTPGARNEACFFYQVTPIPVDYVDISGSGAPLFTPGSDMRAAVTGSGVDLPAPLTYYGVTYPKVWLSAEGWISVLPRTAVGGGNPWLTSVGNNPQGVIAVFWDTLANKANTPEANVYLARVGNATIIQWHHFSYWVFSGSNDDLNFQVKLFDDGTIEFHYADLVPAVPATPYGYGIGATIWLERPWYAETIYVIKNATSFVTNPRIAPHTAYRFSPVP